MRFSAMNFVRLLRSSSHHGLVWGNAFRSCTEEAVAAWRESVKSSVYLSRSACVGFSIWARVMRSGHSDVALLKAEVQSSGLMFFREYLMPNALLISFRP